MRTEQLPDAHIWLRIADPRWSDPLDPTFAQRKGGRWNPPNSFPVLYLNEDLATARSNFVAFAASQPYEPEDLRGDTGPVLVSARLPRQQAVGDVHSVEGVAAAGLAPTYPLDENGDRVGHETCQAIGEAAKESGLRGVRCRSANGTSYAERELAWFPATARSRATQIALTPFQDWFWGPRPASAG